MNTIGELYGLTTKEFNAFWIDPSSHSVLREAIIELDCSSPCPNGLLHSIVDSDIMATKMDLQDKAGCGYSYGYSLQQNNQSGMKWVYL
mmetsp:Transcript_26008/g.38513  ORF Transcript_26008/g.38513 Transcript_26008/m.38513 type:complete len:89 (-) Transcript_26008:394-660(-)